jgi:predicted lipid-binding transport protein (Tim44 family)
MKRTLLAVVAATVAASLITSAPVDAKRIGGGSSLGAQRQSIAPKPPATAQGTPATPGASNQPVMPATPGATLPGKAAAPAAAAAAAPAASGMSRWLGPIAGIAAGLGIAALLSHFGLPEGLGSFLVLALVAIGVIFLVRMLLARRSPATASGPPMYAPERAEPTLAKRTTPDAMWSGPAKADPQVPLPPLQSAGGARDAAIPAGFDAVGFARNAKTQFVRMQAAYDSGDRQQLAELMTPEMLDEVSRELSGRTSHQPTEIVSLEAQVLEATTEGKQHWVSVRYTGLVREDGDSNPKPLDEVWNLTKPVDDSSGWLLAGIQQYA